MLNRLDTAQTVCYNRDMPTKQGAKKMEAFTNCVICEIDLNENEAYIKSLNYICLMCLEEGMREDIEMARYYGEMFTRIY